MDDRTRLEIIDHTVLEDLRPLRRNPRIKGWLTVWAGKYRGCDFTLHEGRNLVGSSSFASVCLDKEIFPDLAFNIRIVEEKWWLIDLDSDAGIKLNDQQVFRALIEDEDWITMENLLFRIKKR